MGVVVLNGVLSPTKPKFRDACNETEGDNLLPVTINCTNGCVVTESLEVATPVTGVFVALGTGVVLGPEPASEDMPGCNCIDSVNATNEAT